jgi:hypothetical protein
MELLETEKAALGERSLLAISSNGGGCQTDPKKEFSLFALSAYINGCRASMREDSTHFAFVRRFVDACGGEFVKAGVFPLVSEFETLAKDRTSEYLTALSGGDADEKMQHVAKKYLLNLGCPTDDVALRIGAVGGFMNGSAATKALFDKLQDSYRFTARVRM